MVKNRYLNSNFGPSEGTKIQHFLRTVSLDLRGDSTSLKVIIQARIFQRMSKILKGGMSKGEDQIKRGGSAMVIGPPRPSFLNT